LGCNVNECGFCAVEEGCRSVIGLRKRVMVVPMGCDTWQTGITEKRKIEKESATGLGPPCMQCANNSSFLCLSSELLCYASI